MLENTHNELIEKVLKKNEKKKNNVLFKNVISSQS